jgi:hypothetical protein
LDKARTELDATLSFCSGHVAEFEWGQKSHPGPL